MNFSSQRAIYHLINYFNNWLLFIYIKIPAILKRQQFNNNEIEKTALIAYKYYRFDERDNKEGQNFDEDESDGNGDRYVSFSLNALLFLF